MRLLQLLGWLMLLAGTAWFLNQRPAGVPDEATTALLAYPLDREVRFSLESGEREVRVLTWLSHPATWARDPRVAHDYQLEAEVRDAAGATIWRRTWWISARDAATTTHLEAGHERLTEDRMTTLRLEGVPTGNRLILRTLDAPEDNRVLMVAWRLAQRPQAHQLRLLNGTVGSFHAEAAQEYGATDWEALSPALRKAKVEREWERLGALPEAGGLVPTERLFTRFEHATFHTDPRDPIPLAPGAAAAWNVVGPATWRGWWTAADGTPTVADGATLRIVHADGTAEVRTLPTVSDIGPISVGDELASIQVALGVGSTIRRIGAELLAGQSWGDPPRAGAAAGPDLRRLELFRTSPGDDGLDFPVPADADLHLSVRARLPASARVGIADLLDLNDGITSVEALDADGVTLGSWSIPIPAAASAFERPAGPDTPGEAAVGAAFQAWIVPPTSTRILRIRGDRTVDVAVRARPRLPFTVPPTDTYPRPLTLLASTRFVPEINDLWTACAPANFAALVAADRVVEIDAQVRLEPAAAPSAAATPRAWSSFDLPGGRTVLAEQGPAQAPTIRLGPTATTLQSDGRLAIDYRVAPERAGQSLALRVDDTLVTRRIPSATGSLVLQVPTSVRLAVETPGLFLARAAGGAAWRRVRVAALVPDQPLVVRVPPGEGGFSIQVYQGGADEGSLEWEVEAPPVDAGVYPHLPSRHDEIPLTPSGGTAEGLSVPGTWNARAPVLVWIPAPGAAKLRLTLRNAPRAAWVRVTSTWPSQRGGARDRNVIRRAP